MTIIYKNQRQLLRTILLYCEGKTETMFVKHVKGIYGSNMIKPRILDGAGGSSLSLVVDAGNVPGDFDKVVVVLDNDGERDEQISGAREYAEQNDIVLLESTPCFESSLLHILTPGCDFSLKSSGFCKKQFQSDYIRKSDIRNPSAFARVFPKRCLDERRADVEILSSIIDCLSGCWERL